MVPGIFAWRLYNMNTCTFHFDFIFAQKCSTQNVKVIPYISLYLYVFLSLPITYAYPHSYPRDPLLKVFVKNLAEDQNGLELAHQVKFERDQGDWIPGLIARRLYNANTCTPHF